MTSGTIDLEGGNASVVARLLGLLSTLPSTPPYVAGEAQRHADLLQELLPPPVRRQGPGARAPGGPVTLDTVAATGVAGLLELLAELPSTPPAVAGEARTHAEELWAMLQPGDPPGDST